MKKILIAFTIATLCCLASCAGGENSTGALSSENSQQVSTPNGEVSVPNDSEEIEIPEGYTKMTAPYTAEDLQTVLFTDVEKVLTVEMSDNTRLQSLLLGAEYYTQAEPNGEFTAKYILALQGVELQIGTNGEVCFLSADETEQKAVVLNEEFAYLDTLIDGNALSFDGYTATQNIQVYNDKNAEGTISNKAEFLQSLQSVRFVKLNNKADYQTGTKNYTVKIDNDEIGVYAKYVTLNGELYAIYEGSFGFLQDIQFSKIESGELPWL
jgi:hypothetical protein